MKLKNRKIAIDNYLETSLFVDNLNLQENLLNECYKQVNKNKKLKKPIEKNLIYNNEYLNTTYDMNIHILENQNLFPNQKRLCKRKKKSKKNSKKKKKIE